MKKIMTPQEFYDFLTSFKYAFVCRELNDNNGVYLRFDPTHITMVERNGLTRISMELWGKGIEVGGCTFFGREFQCDITEKRGDTTVKVTSDLCQIPYTILLRKNCQ